MIFIIFIFFIIFGEYIVLKVDIEDKFFYGVKVLGKFFQEFNLEENLIEIKIVYICLYQSIFLGFVRYFLDIFKLIRFCFWYFIIILDMERAFVIVRCFFCILFGQVYKIILWVQICFFI